MHTGRQTASHTQTGYHRKDTPRHTHAQTCTHVSKYAHAEASTHTQTVAYIHTYRLEHTQTHKRTCARTHKHMNTHTYGESHEQNAHRYTHAKT